MCFSSSLSRTPGSTPSSSSSTARVARIASRASAWRPERYSASACSAHQLSCRGCSLTSRPSSGTASAWRPRASSASQNASRQWVRIPSSRSRSSSRSGASGQSAYGRAAPEVQRLSQQLVGPGRVAGRQQRPAPGGEVGEGGRVQLLALQRQRVSVVPADDVTAGRARGSIGLQGGAQPDHVGLQRLAAGAGRSAVPQGFEQSVDADRGGDRRGQDGQQSALLRARDHDDRVATPPHLQWPENGTLHLLRVGPAVVVR